MSTSKIITKHRLFFLMLAACPGFWWTILQPGAAFKQYSNLGQNFSSKQEIFNEQNLHKIGLMRWAHVTESKPVSLLSKLVYNKATLVFDQLVSLTAVLMPRFYFQAGDGLPTSAQGVEPVPFYFFFFWIIGVLFLIKKKRFTPFYWLFGLSVLLFIFGSRTLIWLWPILVLYVYISSVGVKYIFRQKSIAIFSKLTVLYGAYIIVRAMYLGGLL